MNDEIWVNKDGQELLVGDMSEDYAKNVLRGVLRAIRARKGEREVEKMLSSLANKNMTEGRLDKAEI